MNMKALILGSAITAISLPLWVHAAPIEHDDTIGNRVIVKYKSTGFESTQAKKLSAAQLSELSEALGAPVLRHRSFKASAFSLELPKSTPADQLEDKVEFLNTQSNIEYAEIDHKRFITAMPASGKTNDYYFNSQWYLTSGYGGIKANAAWKQGFTGKGVTIAVVDTGYTPHNDFGDNIKPGYDFISFDNADLRIAATDGDDTPGRDANASDPGDIVTEAYKNELRSTFSSANVDGILNCDQQTESSWHGTAVSGILGAQANNGEGITGIVPDANIIVSRALGKCGGYLSDIMDAARWSAGLAVEGVPANPTPAKIINLSLGGQGKCTITEQRAINEIVETGAIVVVAAGNDSMDVSNYSPANCENVITVGATTQSGKKTTYSNSGAGVDISAPGGSPQHDSGIASTTHSAAEGPIVQTDSSSYLSFHGTSFAAPLVSGVVAMMAEQDSTIDYKRAKQALQASTAFSDGSDCNTSICGAGILNTEKALAAVGAAIPITETTSAVSTSGGSGGGAMNVYALFALLLTMVIARRPKTNA